jgi:hypothetical protein
MSEPAARVAAFEDPTPLLSPLAEEHLAELEKQKALLTAELQSICRVDDEFIDQILMEKGVFDRYATDVSYQYAGTLVTALSRPARLAQRNWSVNYIESTRSCNLLDPRCWRCCIKCGPRAESCRVLQGNAAS